jgi:hypothetical protein
VRIGTWNLDGKWSSEHERLVMDAACDVWLLTEVPEHTAIPDYHGHLTRSEMLTGKRWAGIFSRALLSPMPDPHFASALAQVGELTFCCSILPWRSAVEPPWLGSSQGERTANAVTALVEALPRTRLVWGGDWNHALVGSETTGCAPGQRVILAALNTLGLSVPTRGLPGRREHQLTIDHLAVADPSMVVSVERYPAQERLSDHDSYVIQIA